MGLQINGLLSVGEIIKYSPQVAQEVQKAYNNRSETYLVSILGILCRFSGEQFERMTVEATIAKPSSLGGEIIPDNVIYQIEEATDGKAVFTTGKNFWWQTSNIRPEEMILVSVYNRDRSQSTT